MEPEITFLILYYNTSLHIYTQTENKKTKKSTKGTKLSLTSYIEIVQTAYLITEVAFTIKRKES